MVEIDRAPHNEKEVYKGQIPYNLLELVKELRSHWRALSKPLMTSD